MAGRYPAECSRVACAASLLHFSWLKEGPETRCISIEKQLWDNVRMLPRAAGATGFECPCLTPQNAVDCLHWPG